MVSIGGEEAGWGVSKKKNSLNRTSLGCVHVCQRVAVGVGSSGVCMFHDLILMFILVLNSEVL